MSRKDTLEIIQKTAEVLPEKFIEEAARLVNSSGYDAMSDPICTLIRVALENVADLYDRGQSRTYVNLKRM